MNKEYEKVKRFQKAANQPISNVPKMLDKDRVRIRTKWMKEEIDEFCTANDLVEQADAMIDLIYFALGAMVEMGIKPDSLFEIVHKSNMSKLNTVRVLYDKNGKVQKPKNWQNPYDIMKKDIYKKIW